MNLVIVQGHFRKTVHQPGCSRIKLRWYLTKRAFRWDWAKTRDEKQVGSFCQHAGYLTCHACTPLTPVRARELLS